MTTMTCPQCGQHDFTVWKLPHPLIVHWILNPGLAVNELAFGQRLPKVQAICNRCESPLYERSYVPCPHCETMNSGRFWSGRSRFGNWLGPVCPACSKRIPALWNVFSLLMLAITVPLWYLPYRFYFRDRPAVAPVLSAQETQKIATHVWLRMGGMFAVLMWLILSLIPALFAYWQGRQLATSKLLAGAVVWSIAGVVFALVMYFILNARGKRG